jgi:hypothetical protein
VAAFSGEGRFSTAGRQARLEDRAAGRGRRLASGRSSN